MERTSQHRLPAEASTRVIPLPKDHPTVVGAMIDFFYLSDYDDEMGIRDAQPCSPIMFNVLVFTIADKYDVQPLVDLATEKFCQRAESEWRTTAFANAVRELWENAPEGDRKMQNKVLEVSSAHANGLLKEDYGQAFRKLVAEITLFGTQFQLATLNRTRNFLTAHSTYRCKSCNRQFSALKGQGRVCPYCTLDNTYNKLVEMDEIILL
ncbi:hypothetical protein AC578_1917 [Pseudocercospora eumusae]|uniref:BTB domain-containing protein n=1 Tax=Pseudocercospora eumusae TaxID=321146 RepID=A0A139HDI3_9PEZI|nr:hypothetical protein AC578_1917 [Pseudocercospora eumusae]